MIESFLTQNMVTRGETSIADYLETGQSDFSDIWKESFADLLLDFDAMGLEIRQLCERHSLQTSVTKTAAFDGALSKQDYAQRMRLVIPVSALSGTAPTFTLQGTDDEGTTYTDITLIQDDGTSGTIKTISAVAIGDSSNSYSITRLYEKYRLQLISIGTSVTYVGYMIEEVYTTLHRDKTRSNIYKTLKATDADIWSDKSEQYESMYKQRLSDGRYRVDYTDDGEISKAEGDRIIRNVRCSL